MKVQVRHLYVKESWYQAFRALSVVLGCTKPWGQQEQLGLI